MTFAMPIQIDYSHIFISIEMTKNFFIRLLEVTNLRMNVLGRFFQKIKYITPNTTGFTRQLVVNAFGGNQVL